MAVFTGSGSAASPSITFSADTNTGIFSPGADQVAISTNGAGRVFVDASGRLLLGTQTEGEATGDDLTIATTGSTGITIRSGTANYGNIFFSDGTTGNDEFRGSLQYNHADNFLTIGTNAAERLRITSAGALGLGTSAPAANLHVMGSSAGLDNVLIDAGLNGSGRGLVINTNTRAHAEESVAAFQVIDRTNVSTIFATVGGKVGIGTTSPTFLLELPNVATNAGGRGRSNQWTTYSDGRIKTDREALPYGLDAVMQLEPLRYFHHNSSQDEEGNVEILEEGSISIGLVAQDVQGIIPEIVSVPEDLDKDLCSLDYSKLNIVLVKALQELKAEVDALKALLQAQ